MEAARREIQRGGRVLAVAPKRELVEQIAAAGRSLGLQVGINSAALGERTWRGQVIVASINSVYNHAHAFGPISMLIEDEAHLAPHGQQGMLRALRRGLGSPRIIGGTGTPFRLMGGSLTEGEDAPYQKMVYRYSIMDGIRDQYLVTPFSVPVDDKIDVSKLRVAQGEFTGSSQDAQMLAAMDNHIAQMLHYGRDRRTWLVFEASVKAAKAMAQRMNEWGIPTGLVIGDRTKAEAANRRKVVEDLRHRRIRAAVNVDCLTTGTDVQEIDMLVCRRRTKSLGLWMQILGRMLRTIGGNLDASILAGKSDSLLLDFADNTSEFGPIDWIRPKDTPIRLVSCEACGKRNGGAAARCWSCDEPMTKLCPACLVSIRKGLLDCPECGHDMRTGGGDAAPRGAKLLETPSGAALISAWAKGSAREGGWVPVRKAWERDGKVIVDTAEQRVELPEALTPFGGKARWIRVEDATILIPNGASRTSILQVTPEGVAMVIPMPPAIT
jgi:DNA repair protein RadD